MPGRNKKKKSQSEEKELDEPDENEIKNLLTQCQDPLLIKIMNLLIGIDAKLRDLTSSFKKQEENYKNQENKIKELEEKFLSLDQGNDLMKDYQNNLVKNSVFVVGFPINPDAFKNKNPGKESPAQTMCQVKQMLKKFNLDKNQLIESCYRLPSPNFNKKLPGMIRINFVQHHHKMELISTIRSSKQNDIRTKIEFPAYLNKERQKLSKKAYIMRNLDKELQTQVIHRKYNAILQTRKSHNEEWKDEENK